MMQAPVNKIIPFSNVDGPGNRCAIFFQSCPFRCLYCHNPETIEMCNDCGTCVTTCPTHALKMEHGKVTWESSLCVSCDQCIKVCENLASPKIKMMDVDLLLEEIAKKKAFIRGITVSGGECMNHATFLLALFRGVKAMGLTCLIDSNGMYDFALYPELLALCDGVMLDVKAVDMEFHRQLTKCDNTIVLKNLNYLLEHNKLEEVRTVILPKVEEQNFKTVRYVATILGNKSRYKLIKYRGFGVREEGIAKFGYTIVSDEEMLKYEMLCRSCGNDTSVII